jgi:hypothetical protein
MMNKKRLAAAVAAAYPQPEDWPTSERMNNIGPNGNDGDHYAELEKDEEE